MDVIKRALLGDQKAQNEMTENGELLPCQCGGEAKVITRIDEEGQPFKVVLCLKCRIELQGLGDTEEKEKELIKDWNTRPQLLMPEEMEKLDVTKMGYERACRILDPVTRENEIWHMSEEERKKTLDEACIVALGILHGTDENFTTRGDMIRSMSNEELADFICGIAIEDDCYSCPVERCISLTEGRKGPKGCEKWLREIIKKGEKL